jgi:membrane-associated protease RseP (regulator of RpoE activity)
MESRPEEISGTDSLAREEHLGSRTTILSLLRRGWLHLFLFGATVLTTLIAGALQQGVNPVAHPWELALGIPFSFTLMAILLTHEMGHYLTSRYHGVEATLPYFIPAPSIIGTFGAFIRMRSPIMNKRALLDIGASGPIAGFVLSIVAVAVGLHYSEVVKAGNLSGIGLGAPLGFQFISYFIIGPVSEEHDVLLNPIAFAGWIGFFVTALNLIPIGQLDGGHVVYAIIGKHHRTVSMTMIPLMIVMGFFGWAGWYLWAVLPLLFGMTHPPIVNQEEALDKPRKIIGWMTLIIFVACFTPTPFVFL